MLLFDVVMAMYNLTEHSDAYSQTSGSLWQYYRDELDLDNNGNINFPDDSNNSASLKFKLIKQETVAQKILK